jgi:hypothetical protein
MDQPVLHDSGTRLTNSASHYQREAAELKALERESKATLRHQSSSSTNPPDFLVLAAAITAPVSNSAAPVAAAPSGAPVTPAANQVTNTVADTNTVTNTNLVANTNIAAQIQIAADADVDEEFGSTFKRCFYVGEIVIENKDIHDSLLVKSGSIMVDINYFVADSQWNTNISSRIKAMNIGFGIPMEVATNLEYIVGRRRPSTYSDILAIFEYQRKANWRQRFIDALKSAGEIAAAATIFVGGPTYPKAVAFATGVITPEIEKNLLWDVLLHAKNLESRSLKEVEEIEPGGAVHRLVFFPKRGVPGLLPNNLVYISAFSQNTPITVSGTLIEHKSRATTAVQ